MSAMEPHLLVACGRGGDSVVSRVAEGMAGLRQGLEARMLALASNEFAGGELKKPGSAIAESVKSLLLGKGGAGALNEITVVAIASASDEESSKAFGLLAEVSKSIGSKLPGVIVHCECAILLPEGECREAPWIAQLLEDARNVDQQESTPLVTTLLLTPTENYGSRVTPEDLEALLAELLVLRCSTGLGSWIRQWIGQSFARFVCAGACSLELPVHRIFDGIVAEYGRKTAAALAELPCDSEAAKSGADNYLARQNLQESQIADLRRDHRTWEERDLAELLTVSRFLFDELKMERWPEALANYDAFFHRERFGPVLKRLELIADRIRRKTEEELRKAVDAVLNEGCGTSTALALLERVNAGISKTRERFAVRERKPSTSENSKIAEAIQALRDAIARIPSWPAIIVKSLAIGMLGGLAMIPLTSLAFVHVASGRILDLAAWLSGIGLSFLIAFLIGLRARTRAHHAAWDLAHKVENAIGEKYQSRLAEEVEVRLSELLGAIYLMSLKVELLNQEAPDYTGASETMIVGVLESALREQLPSAFEYQEVPFASGWRFDAREWFARSEGFPFRRQPDYSDWQGEARSACRQGTLKDWRRLDMQTVAQGIQQQVSGGCDWVLALTLDEFAAESLGNPEFDGRLRELSNALRRAARVMLLVPPNALAGSDPIPLADSPNTNALLHRLMDDTAGAVDVADKLRLLLVCVAELRDVSRLTALPVWQAASPAKEKKA